LPSYRQATDEHVEALAMSDARPQNGSSLIDPAPERGVMSDARSQSSSSLIGRRPDGHPNGRATDLGAMSDARRQPAHRPAEPSRAEPVPIEQPREPTDYFGGMRMPPSTRIVSAFM
jgi:hypothetical protein